MTTEISPVTISAAPTSPPHSDLYSSPRSPRTIPDTWSPMSLRSSPADSPSSLLPKTPTKPPKKRGASLFDFFGVKEPSNQALLEYQEFIRKQTPKRDGRIVAVGMPGVSSAKLPPTVPKVNSKWDGVPPTREEREREKERANRHSFIVRSHSTRSSRSEASQSNPIPSIGLAAPTGECYRRGRVLGFHGFVSDPASIGGPLNLESSNVSSTSVLSRSEAKDCPSSEGSSVKSSSTNGIPDLVPFVLSDIPKPPAIPGEYLGERLTSSSTYTGPPIRKTLLSPVVAAESPVVPLAPSAAERLSFLQFQLDSKENPLASVLRNQPSLEKVILRSSGSNILGPPVTAKRRTKSCVVQSTQMASNKASREIATPPSILKKDQRNRKSMPAPRPPSSSHLLNVEAECVKRTNSSRDRLGLGMSLKGGASAPWDLPDDVKDDADPRVLTPTPRGGGTLRRKNRLSMFARDI